MFLKNKEYRVNKGRLFITFSTYTIFIMYNVPVYVTGVITYFTLLLKRYVLCEFDTEKYLTL